MEYCAAIKIWIHVIPKWIEGITLGIVTWEKQHILKAWEYGLIF